MNRLLLALIALSMSAAGSPIISPCAPIGEFIVAPGGAGDSSFAPITGAFDCAGPNLNTGRWLGLPCPDLSCLGAVVTALPPDNVFASNQENEPTFPELPERPSPPPDGPIWLAYASQQMFRIDMDLSDPPPPNVTDPPFIPERPGNILDLNATDVPEPTTAVLVATALLLIWRQRFWRPRSTGLSPPRKK